MSIHTRLIALFLAVLGALPTALRADRGSIPFRPSIQIYEPRQRGVVVWSQAKGEQMLILSTDLEATRPTKVIEVMPIPSAPTKLPGQDQALPFLVDTGILDRCETFAKEARAKIVAELGVPEREPVRLRGGGMARGLTKGFTGGSAEVISHGRVGQQDITIVEVTDQQSFVRDLQAFIRRRSQASADTGYGGFQNEAGMMVFARDVVGEYLKQGFRHFVLAEIELGTGTTTNEAVAYSFQTDALFYPMKISKLEAGFTRVELFVLTDAPLKSFHELDRQVQLRDADIIDRGMHRKAAALQRGQITGAEYDAQMKRVRELVWYHLDQPRLGTILGHPGLTDHVWQLLGSPEKAVLRPWRIQGYLSDFTQDIVANNVDRKAWLASNWPRNLHDQRLHAVEAVPQQENAPSFMGFQVQ